MHGMGLHNLVFFLTWVRSDAVELFLKSANAQASRQHAQAHVLDTRRNASFAPSRTSRTQAANSTESIRDGAMVDDNVGAIIFLHGLGSNGEEFRNYLHSASGGTLVENLEAAGVRTFFPNGALQPCLIGSCRGQTAPLWYSDPGPLDPTVPEETESINYSYRTVLGPLLDELEATIGLDKVLVGGHSLGAGMALQMLRLAPPGLAGLFAMGTYMSFDSKVWDALDEQGARIPPVWMSHGTDDDIVDYDFGAITAAKLQEHHVNVTWHKLDGLGHDLEAGVCKILNEWLQGRLLDRRVDN